MEFFRGLPGGTKSSTLVDLEAGRPLETPGLSGRIVTLGREHGIDTPANAAVVAGLAPHAGGRGPVTGRSRAGSAGRGRREAAQSPLDQPGRTV